MTEKYLLTLFRIIVVLEHLIKHKVEELLVRNEKFDKLLAFDLRELFNFFGRTCFHDAEISLKQIRLATLRLTHASHR